MAETIPSNLSLGSTAHWTAEARAVESAREDRLFNDPWAAALAGKEGEEWLARQAGSLFGTTTMVIRTRYFDDFLYNTAWQQNIRQFVILAAGLDTRAFRLHWPAGAHLFELDQPAVLQYKDQILRAAGAKPGCERQTIPVDLNAPWQAALLDCGYDPLRPSAWLLEGFLFYLHNQSIVDVLTNVSELAAPGSWLGFDVVNSQTLISPITRSWVEMQAKQGAPWLGALDDPEGFLCSLGWKTYLTQPGAENASYGRWTLPVIPVKMPDMPHNWLVTAQKT